MSDEPCGKAEADHFLDVLVAMMEAAATTGEITQMQTTITPPGASRPKIVRIIVLPEEMEVVRHPGGKYTVPA